MNSANAIYKDILNVNGFPLECENNKKYLKTLTRVTINVLTIAVIHYFSWYPDNGPPVGVRVWFRVSVRIRVGGEFSSGAYVLEPFFLMGIFLNHL